MGEVCSSHKLKINQYKPDHYPKHTDITEADLEETMTVMFLRKLEDAKHAIDTHMKRNETDNDDEAEGTEADHLDADAQKRKKQATDEQGYEESCDDEKKEPSFTR
ncbi:hypothetical protein Bca52824_008305 [Brassica carinata]|uniref:Uncharacterized protein n=1 Tax=Brassica carinata TaxID=52824 RepID=A0A8X7W9Y9_BRACI|nr:hypothetical protein Bca52824_008305 [Brassica carinata]